MSQQKKLVRNLFREAVFRRDNYQCKICDHDRDLDAHHITDRTELPNGGYVKENGITLCPVCHLKAEKYHSTKKQWHIVGFLPNDLYKLINSSFSQAFEASLVLTQNQQHR